MFTQTCLLIINHLIDEGLGFLEEILFIADIFFDGFSQIFCVALHITYVLCQGLFLHVFICVLCLKAHFLDPLYVCVFLYWLCIYKVVFQPVGHIFLIGLRLNRISQIDPHSVLAVYNNGIKIVMHSLTSNSLISHFYPSYCS